VKGD
jgi:hypothetical protein